MFTKGDAFRTWAKNAGLRGRDGMPYLSLLSRRPDADILIESAVTGTWTKERMATELGMDMDQQAAPRSESAAQDPAPAEEATTRAQRHEKMRTRTTSAPQTAGPAGNPSDQPAASAKEKSTKPSLFSKIWGKIKNLRVKDPAPVAVAEGQVGGEAAAKPKKAPMSKKTVAIIGGSVLAVILLGVGMFMYSQSTSQGSFNDPVFNDPSFNNQPLGSPTNGLAQTPGQAAPSEPDRWQQFLDMNKKDTSTVGPFLDKPVLNDPNSPYYVFKHFPSRWLLWIFPIMLMWTLVKQDRVAAEEITDITASRRGLWALFVGVLGGSLIATAINTLLVSFGSTFAVQSWPFVFIGIVLNVWSTWQASTSGRTDYTVLSVVGLFITGVVMIWWFTPNVYLTVVGAILMLAGIILETKEMSRTHQGRSALLTTLIMLLIFGGITWLGYYLLGLVPSASTSMSLVQQFVLTLLFVGRIFISACFGLGLAYAGGDYFSTLLMPPASANGTVFTGKQEVNNHVKYNDGPLDDFNAKWKINSRFDAMNFAIMILYPIITSIWFIVLIF